MTGFLALIAVLVATTAFGLVWRARNGRVRAAKPARAGQAEQLGSDDLGVALGERVTLVQFSTAFCQPCRATRRVLAEVAGMVDGVAHVEIDAEANLELVRRLDIRRTPTVLVLDPRGRVVKRASGAPRKADIIAAIGSMGSVA